MSRRLIAIEINSSSSTMNNNSSAVPANYQKEIKNPSSEVANLEKQLWALIHSRGLLQIEVQDLYHKACSAYENIILNDHELAELQDIEYSLWKLHYKHIDEFRKRIRRNSFNAESKKSAMPQSFADLQNKSDNHVEGFKSFLSEASQVYQDLIIKTRKCYGLPEKPLFHGSDGVSCSVEPKKLHKCQFLCHRFLICLGDLARYRELYGQPDTKNHNWSVAVTYYLNASMTWPDSGNPQNQLAVLATYIGDEFLALYHCVRSLAVKEPFPDAWDNLMLLFEKNGSSCSQPLSGVAHFDFCNPSERSFVQNNLESSDGLSSCQVVEATKHRCSGGSELWSLFIRMISFFFVQSSLEDFPCTFASAMADLESLMDLDDTKLKDALESYQHMDSSRTGPFKALQVVSVLIFVVQNLIANVELEKPKPENGTQQPVLTQLALTATFIFMGRLVDRCLKCNPIDSCPLLPAVLVSVEWLVGMLDKVEMYGTETDEKCRMAVSYFFSTFDNLLNQFGCEMGEVGSPDRTALWEDYELLGFAPLADAHVSLNFSTHWEHVKSFKDRKECRSHRILEAGMKIANSSNSSRKWILCDESKRKFSMAEEISERRESEVALSTSDLDVEESYQNILRATKECDGQALEENHSSLNVNGKSVAMEEEEVILFKPITRYNSVPLHAYTTNDQMSLEAILRDQQSEDSEPPDECLRRASSLLVAQRQAPSNPFTFHSNVGSFRGNKPFKKQETAPATQPSSETLIAAGPPSLSGWVLNRGSLSIEREKGAVNNLRPIEEIASAAASLGGLSISENEDSLMSSRHVSTTTDFSSSYTAPVPSAPFIPDDAVWFNGVPPSTFSECNSSGGIVNRTTNSFLDASQERSYSNWAASHRPSLGFRPSITGLMDGYPLSRGMTNSSEWIYPYQNKHNLDGTNSSHVQPQQFYSPATFGNSYGYTNTSRFDLFDNRWGNSMAPNSVLNLERPPSNPGLPPRPPYSVDELTREKLYQNYQRPSFYGCGAMTEDLRGEQPPLLQYLKEREWRLQQEAQVRSSPTYNYMGN